MILILYVIVIKKRRKNAYFVGTAVELPPPYPPPYIHIRTHI